MGIPVDYETLEKNHYFHYNIKSKLDGEVAGYSPPCCIQVSYALNLSGAPIERGDYWVPEWGRYSRYASDKSGRLYLIEVCDMGAYLNKYGVAENHKGTVDQMKQKIAGRKGILRFGIAHIDLWDGKRFHQESGPGLPDSWAKGQPPVAVWGAKSVQSAGIYFWEATGSAASKLAPTTAPPEWLKGWWKVWDGGTYYYYFGEGGGVVYTRKKPANTRARPARADNTGIYSYAANRLVIDWKWVTGAEVACQELFYNASPQCRQMNATSNLYSPLVATRDLD